MECRASKKGCSDAALAHAHQRAIEASREVFADNIGDVINQFGSLAVLVDRNIDVVRDVQDDLDEVRGKVEEMRDDLLEVRRRPAEQARDVNSLFSIVDDVRNRQNALEAHMSTMRREMTTLVTNTQQDLLMRLESLADKRRRSPSPESSQKRSKFT